MHAAKAEAKSHGFDLNEETGELSADCNVCGVYSVLPESMYCQPCIDEYHKSKHEAAAFKVGNSFFDSLASASTSTFKVRGT